jgi:hypothetical protein
MLYGLFLGELMGEDEFGVESLVWILFAVLYGCEDERLLGLIEEGEHFYLFCRGVHMFVCALECPLLEVAVVEEVLYGHVACECLLYQIFSQRGHFQQALCEAVDF